MKKLNLLLFIGALVLSSCKKEDKEPITPTPTNPVNVSTDIVGTWSEAQHLIDGGNSSSAIGRTISFFSNGTYTSQFTYPWHCEPCANSTDSGVWSYNSTDSSITLTSTKNQTEYCPSVGMDATHDNQTQMMSISSYTTNEFIVEFIDVNCSQNVVITFHR